MAQHIPDLGTYSGGLGTVTIEGNQALFPANATKEITVPNASLQKFRFSYRAVAVTPTGTSFRRARFVIKTLPSGPLRVLEVSSTDGTSWNINVLNNEGITGQPALTNQAVTFPVVLSIERNGNFVTYRVGSWQYLETINGQAFNTGQIDFFDSGGLADDLRGETF